MQAVIPLQCNGFAGSGFLCSRGFRAWLVTCFHNVHGETIMRTDYAPPLTSVFKITGTYHRIPLFDTQGRPRYKVPHDPADRTFWDVIGIELDIIEAATLKNYCCFDVTSIGKPEVGQKIQMTGFTGAGTSDLKFSEIETTVLQSPGGNFSVADPSLPGMSGGPVTCGNILIGVIHGTTGKGRNPGHGIVTRLDIFADYLFV